MKALVPDLAMVPKLLISSSATATAIKLLAPSCKLIKKITDIELHKLGMIDTSAKG